MLLSTAQNHTLRWWFYTCTIDCIGHFSPREEWGSHPEKSEVPTQNLRRTPHSHASGHWIPGAAAECQLLPGSSSFCQCHMSKGTCVSDSKTKKVPPNPFLSKGTVYAMQGFRSGWIRNLNERVSGTWPKGPAVLEKNKVSSQCQRILVRAPHGSCMQRQEGCSTYLTCQKDHMHPKRQKPCKATTKLKTE